MATIATKILLSVAFEFFECDRVEIACNKANKPSLKVIEKSGFKYEGEIKNYFSKPTPAMIENGYHPERAGLQYALVQEEIEDLDWFDAIKDKITTPVCIPKN